MLHLIFSKAALQRCTACLQPDDELYLSFEVALTPVELTALRLRCAAVMKRDADGMGQLTQRLKHAVAVSWY